MIRVFFKIKQFIEFSHWIYIKLVWSSWELLYYVLCKILKEFLKVVSNGKITKRQTDIFFQANIHWRNLCFRKVKFFQTSLGSPILYSRFVKKNFFSFSLVGCCTLFLASLCINSSIWSLLFLNVLNNGSYKMLSKLTIKAFVGLVFHCNSFIRSKIIYSLCYFIH